MNAQDVRDRRLRCEPCLNVRDVGGYQTTDGATIRRNALLRGDNLCNLSADGCAMLLAYGLRTVIDLRHAAEIEAAVHPFGPRGEYAGAVDYRNLAARDPDDATFEAALLACQSQLEIYKLYLDRCSGRVAAIVRAIADAPEGAVIVHCHVGKDRTGIIIALLLAVAGVQTETIVADYAVSAGYLKPLYEERVAAGREESYDAWRSEPETMRALLDYLDMAHGGARQYMLAAGVTADEIDLLRARLRDEPATADQTGVSPSPGGVSS